ncbi:MAG: 7-carboxy-7-deazaguanine synthase QueE [Bacteroidetes bacterium]|nr:MAG: 7-carboxy-7-deazaguanine synthase QueE [Bacteroidota bacterium]
MEHYYTIQGEGYNTGKAAYFIRLGGCEVGCVWCDVKDSWDASRYPMVMFDEMLNVTKEAGARRVVVTGGEPLMYDLSELCKTFKAAGIELYLETSGAYKLSGEWDWICVSPKKFMQPIKETLEKADELKVIVYNSSDFDWAKKHAAIVRPQCKLFLQPEYSVRERVLPDIIDFVKRNPDWQISLQTHKVMQIP